MYIHLIAASSGGDLIGLKLFATAVFVALNGYFVAAEFALVKARASRIEAAVNRGDKRAVMVQKMLGNMDQYLSACQLGITIASLVLGYLAEPAVAALLLMGLDAIGIPVADSVLVHYAAIAIALIFITILHMTIGEQAPKVFALRKPERVSLALAPPLMLFELVLRPLIKLVNAISNMLLRFVGVVGTTEHGETVSSMAELRTVVDAASRAGHITVRQHNLTDNVLGLMRLEVRHIMLPRVDVTYLSLAKSVEENLQVVRTSHHTRLPVGNPDLDTVAGMIHGKDLLAHFIDGGGELDLLALARELPAVPDTQPIARFIAERQKDQTQMALVVDEHGTSVGLAFLEDALEEIVGPIRDEFDHERPGTERAAADELVLAGSVPLPEAAELLGLDVDGEEDTIGGYLIKVLGRTPEVGDVVELGPYTATIRAMSKRRVSLIQFVADSDDVNDPDESAPHV